MSREGTQSSQKSQDLLSILDAAKQINAIVPILQAAYFAAVSMSDLRKVLWERSISTGYSAILTGIFVLPVILWLASFIIAVRLFVPSTVSPEVEHFSGFQEEQSRRGLASIRKALYCLEGGLIVLAFNVVFYILVIPPPTSK